jgi:hypothetical protein
LPTIEQLEQELDAVAGELGGGGTIVQFLQKAQKQWEQVIGELQQRQQERG